MTQSLGLIHTVVNLVPVFADLTQRYLPDWSVFNIVDESLLKNTIRSGELQKVTMRRLAGHVWSAVDAGADAVMVTCSSVGPAVDATAPFCPVKLFRVDEAMADEAIDLGARIGVLATLRTTLGPTRDLVERRAARRAKPVSLSHSVCEGAFEALQRGDRERHDGLVKAELLKIAKSVDVVVLAQASMARVAEGLPRGELSVPVLSSPELAVKRLSRDLGAAA